MNKNTGILVAIGIICGLFIVSRLIHAAIKAIYFPDHLNIYIRAGEVSLSGMTLPRPYEEIVAEIKTLDPPPYSFYARASVDKKGGLHLKLSMFQTEDEVEKYDVTDLGRRLQVVLAKYMLTDETQSAAAKSE